MTKIKNMETLKDVEVINIYTKGEKLIALVSFQDTSKIVGLNNGYDILEIPINLRDIQKSVRGNILVDQSVKDCVNSVFLQK